MFHLYINSFLNELEYKTDYSQSLLGLRNTNDSEKVTGSKVKIIDREFEFYDFFILKI